MKKINFYSAILFCCFAFFSCNDEWKDEQYEKYVSFVKSGETNVNLNYNAEGGRISYRIPVEVSGSTANDRDVQVTIAVDVDTLARLNLAQFNNREDLYYLQLNAAHYRFPTMQTTIPAGSNIGYIDMEFNLSDLNLYDKYMLPLTIEATSEYIPSPKRWYKKTLMRIVPFNDYSGVYSATAGNIYEEDAAEPIAMTVESREARVVDERSIFFYAGVVEETAKDRAMYKITATLNDDYSVTLTADSAETIGFSYTASACTYTVNERMDEVQPYLKIRTVTLHLKYKYSEIYPGATIKYRFDGSYTLERRRNTLIPEEDQQDVFE